MMTDAPTPSAYSLPGGKPASPAKDPGQENESDFCIPSISAIGSAVSNMCWARSTLLKISNGDQNGKRTRRLFGLVDSNVDGTTIDIEKMKDDLSFS
jgi:hypothetical protein